MTVSPQLRLELLKQNSPSIFKSYVDKRKHEIPERLELLRSRYKGSSEQERVRIKAEADELNKELALISSMGSGQPSDLESQLTMPPVDQPS